MTPPTRFDVRETWTSIGPHFARTRVSPWPEVEQFTDTVSGDRGLDVGTGNGRHATLLAERLDDVVAVDVSAPLLDIAASATPSNVECVLGDAVTLPIRDACIDVGLSVATIHHLPTPAMRHRSIEELCRVLAPGGTALVSVWSTTHDAFDAVKSFDTTVEWTLPDGDVVDRYYHIYTPTDFRTLIESTGASIEAFTVSSGNCYATITPST